MDAETGKVIPLAGAGFRLYRPDGSLITQTFTYPKVTTIDTFYTNGDAYCCRFIGYFVNFEPNGLTNPAF